MAHCLYMHQSELHTQRREMGEQQDENEVQELLEDESGVAYVEYVILLSLVTVLGSVAVFSVGLPFFTTYRFTQLLVALPFP